MSKSSEAVLKWRTVTKARIIEAMGGACCCCGYDRCDAALELHHLDPAEKEGSIAAMRVAPKSWARIVTELRKCVLVCANCHREIHQSVRSVPDSAARFDEGFADYREVERRLKVLECPVCAGPMKAGSITCSLVCSGKRRTRGTWEGHDLAAMAQTMSLVAIGRVVGVSDKAVHKRMKKLGIKR